MGLVVAVGIGSFVLVCLLVGTRLVRLAARTRQLPEAAMGTTLLLNGVVSYGLIIVSTALPDVATPARALGTLVGAVGTSALALFNWRVFRKDAAGAGVFALLTAANVLSFLARLATGDFGHAELRGALAWTGMWASTAVFGWASFEAARYFDLSRRREALGLADAETTRRFLWWSIGSGAAMAIYLYSIARIWAGASLDPTAPGSAIPTAALGLLSAASIWRAFRSSDPPPEPGTWADSRD